ncbi:MAG: c-type cytochrome [Myxococcaceae bacterium]|nr:c-type cytochrome [Myxococcaceae bacterium]
MKIRALAVAVALVGCNQAVPTYTSSSGSLALSNDDGTLYAVDSDSNQLFVLDARSEELKAAIAVGAQPEKVVVGKDDTIYVSNRMGRSVSVIRYGEWKEATRLDTAVEPSGMAVSGDTLLVVNATMLDNAEVGSLMAFDTKTLSLQWELAVGPEPRAIAVTGNNAMVSLYKEAGAKKGGDIVTVDLRSHQVVSAKTETFAQVNKSALETRTNINGGTKNGPFDPSEPVAPEQGFGGPAVVRPRGIEALTVSPDGRNVYAATLLSSDTVLPATPGETSKDVIGPRGSGGDGYGGGSCGAGSVATPSLLTYNDKGESLATDVGGCQGQNAPGLPPQVLVSGNPTMPIQGPSAVAVDPTGAFLFVAGRESNNVAIVTANASTLNASNGVQSGGGLGSSPPPFDTRGGVGFFGQGSVHTTVTVGAGPSGVALARDGKTAWVHNAFDHSISRLERKDGVVQTVRTSQFTGDTLAPAAVAGRKLFFSAADSRMSASTTGISCASCHLEGREDSHVWNFSDGPRQTPSLAGRMLSKTAPFHWNGEFEGLTQFMATTVNHRMGGVGVSAAMEAQIMAFIESQPVADNPHRSAQLSERQQRGFAAFAKAQCNTCHKGETLTDNSFVNVGTYVTGKTVNDDVRRFMHGGLNTPSLLGVARTGPYLHDGSAMTLKERITKDRASGNGLHGNVQALSETEVDDLVEYLKAL